MEKRDSYSDTLKQIGIDKFRDRLNELLCSAETFIEKAGYEDYVQCNERIMTNVLLDYFSDIIRLKEFHDIESVRTEKIYAYTAAWIIRRKPLQFIRYSDEEKDMFVNERFAAYLMVNECLLCGEKKYVAKESKEKLDEYLDLLLYYFKYRECNPQVLELAIESFKMGELVI